LLFLANPLIPTSPPAWSFVYAVGLNNASLCKRRSRKDNMKKAPKQEKRRRQASIERTSGSLTDLIAGGWKNMNDGENCGWSRRLVTRFARAWRWRKP
jgi:hypothetical protein